MTLTNRNRAVGEVRRMLANKIVMFFFRPSDLIVDRRGLREKLAVVPNGFFGPLQWGLQHFDLDCTISHLGNGA